MRSDWTDYDPGISARAHLQPTKSIALPSAAPTYRGFDTYTGYYSGAEEHFTHYKAGEGKNYFDLANNSGSHVSPLFSMVGKTQNETEEYYSVYIYGNETVRLIKRHAELYASSPLYVYLAWNVVHAPDEAPAWAVDLNPEEKNHQRQLFAGMLSALDVGVRHIIDELKTQSMWEKTIFVFSAGVA
jgi:arylsulfatase A-like enzyme